MNLYTVVVWSWNSQTWFILETWVDLLGRFSGFDRHGWRNVGFWRFDASAFTTRGGSNAGAGSK